MRGIFLTLLCGAAGMTIGLMITRPDTSIVEARAQEAVESSQRDRLVAAFERIRANYVDEPDQSELVTAAINGMIGVLDSQSVYLDWKTFRDLQIHDRRTGLGLEVIMEQGSVRVIAPIDGSPAATAGIMVNDVITHIDGVPLQGLTIYQVVEKMRGAVKTNVRLAILRDGHDKPLELTAVRQNISMRSVRMCLVGDDIGYIRIAMLNDFTMSAFATGIIEWSYRIPQDQIKGYVLDLRNNPGGFRDVAVSLADKFLEDEEIVSVRGRNADIERFNARPGDSIHGKPLIVLINGGSAGGAEIVAGALQDNKRATVIGSRSFGKGSVQNILHLGGRHGALRLTTGRYFTPSGKSIDSTGIVPDIEVVQNVLSNPEDDHALKLAYDLLRGVAYNQAFPPSKGAAAVPR